MAMERSNTGPKLRVANGHSNGSKPTKEPAKKSKDSKLDDNLVLEKFKDREVRLTRVRSSKGYNEGAALDEKVKKPDDGGELVSGRTAGAGWEKSRYVAASIASSPLNI